MTYTITSGASENEIAVVAQYRESATEVLELVKELQAKEAPNIRVTDRDGVAVTIAQLEKLSDKENI